MGNLCKSPVVPVPYITLISVVDLRITEAGPDPPFHFIANPDPTFHFGAVTDPTLHFRVDPDSAFYAGSGFSSKCCIPATLACRSSMAPG